MDRDKGHSLLLRCCRLGVRIGVGLAVVSLNAGKYSLAALPACWFGLSMSDG